MAWAICWGICGAARTGRNYEKLERTTIHHKTGNHAGCGNCPTRNSVLHLFMKLILTLLLCTNLVVPAKPQEAVAVGVTVVVVCVGGVCIYKVVKFCQKKFPPKDTNAPPDSLSLDSGEYGGAFEYSSIGSCYVPPEVNSFPYEDLLHAPTTFTLSVLLTNGAIATTMSADATEGTAQSWSEFQAEIASHGLLLTGHPAYEPQFERNGAPCSPEEVPLTFDNVGKVTQHGYGEHRTIVIERSPNLQDWYPLMVTDIPDGTGFKIIDTTREQSCFYRVTEL